MRANQNHRSAGLTITLVAYYSVLVAFLVGAFFPEHRVWGVNWWAYFPYYVPFVLFAIGAIAPLVIRIVPTRDTSDDRSSKYFIVATGLIVLYGLAFYFLRARTHFLGDGYTVLSLLAHIWVKNLIGGESERAALLSFQIISIAAGVLFLTIVAVFARFLFERTRDRILFLLGLASGGYMLLFFGYVENYSLFVLSVAVYSLMGLLVVKGKLNRWLILPVVALEIFFHVLGVTLIPSALYLLLANSKLGDFLARLSRQLKLLIALVIAVMLLSVFYYFYTTDYFFRFAFVPLLENRFTVEGYTLFSLKHVLDYLNLLILLLPGLPVVAAVLLFLPMRKILKQRECRYLFILLVSTLGAVFVFDPKVGMPRDWDLFSFCGVPISIFAYYLYLNERQHYQYLVTISTLSFTLGFLALLPRAVAQVLPEVSVSHFKSYCKYDRAKNRTGRAILIDYYKKAGNEEAERLEIQRAYLDFPEKRLADSAAAIVATGKSLEAVPLLRRVLEVNTLYADAWANLGKCQVYMHRYEDAIESLELANGLNPYHPIILNDLGVAYLSVGNYNRAEEMLQKSHSRSPSQREPLVNLVRLYTLWGRSAQYNEYFIKLSLRSDAPSQFLKGLGDWYLGKKDFTRSAEAFRAALQKGLDSVYVKQLIAKYPELSAQFLLQAPLHDSSESRQ